MTAPFPRNPGHRFARLRLAIVVLASVLVTTALMCGADPRWSVAAAAVDDPSRVVAVGDVHGDADGFVRILRRAGLIDNQDRWIGERATLVQTGDVMDSGANVRDVMDLLMALEEQAQGVGGRVVSLLGNHEVMNLLGELRDVNPQVYEAFAGEQSERRREVTYEASVALAGSQPAAVTALSSVYQFPPRDAWMERHPPGFLEYLDALSPEGRYGRWLREKEVVVQLADTIFMHAGIDPDHPAATLDEVNEQARKELRDFDRYRRELVDRGVILPHFTLQETLDAVWAHVQAAAAQLRAPDDADGAVVMPVLADAVLREVVLALLDVGSWSLLEPGGPLWFRGYVRLPSDPAGPRIAALLERYEAERFVVGHTPLPLMRITPRFGFRVFAIDTGMLSSRFPGGRPSALEIVGERLRAVYLEETVELRETPSGLPPRGRTPGGATRIAPEPAQSARTVHGRNRAPRSTAKRRSFLMQLTP